MSGTASPPIVYSSKARKVQPSDWNDAWAIASSVTKAITQATHGFSVADAIFRDDDTNAWVAKAKSDAIDTLGTHVVSKVADANTFTAQQSGAITGLSGLTDGLYYYVSDTTAGRLTTTEGAEYSNPLLLADSTTTGWVLPFRASDNTSPKNVETDYDSGNGDILYTGLAVPGSATSSAVWQVTKLDTTASGELEYADSNTNFDNIYDNRESLSYGDL